MTPAPPPVARALPVVIDIEASGFGRGSYPIEIGFVLPDGSAWCTLVRPESGWTHWDAAAERVHGIARDTLARHGRAATEVAAALNDRLCGLAVYSDNWAHDYAWLAILFEAADCTPRFRLHHLHELLDEASARRWDDARQEAERALATPRHRASNDARVLQRTLAQLPPWQRDRGETPIHASR